MSQSRSTKRIRISLASGAGNTRSPVGLIGAVLLHGVVLGATLFTWEHRLDIAEETPPVVPVDLVTIAQKTNIVPTARSEPQIAPVPIPQPAPQQPAMAQPAVPEEEAPSDQTAPKPVPKAKPQPDKNKFNIDNVMALLNKVAPSQQQRNVKTAAVAHQGIGAQNAMTMDLRDALKNQIEQCWSPPAGAPHPEQLIVYFDLSLNPDGSVARPPQLTAQSSAAASSNPFMAAAADAAKRAIYVCAPYKLPADRYADWRESTVEFDPRDLMGQ